MNLPGPDGTFAYGNNSVVQNELDILIQPRAFVEDYAKQPQAFLVLSLEHLSVGRVNVPNDALGNQTHIFAVAAVERLCEALPVRSVEICDGLRADLLDVPDVVKRGYLLENLPNVFA